MLDDLNNVIQAGVPGLPAGYETEIIEFGNQQDRHIVNKANFPRPENRLVYAFEVPENGVRYFGVSSTFGNDTTRFLCRVDPPDSVDTPHDNILVFASPGDIYRFETQVNTRVFAVVDVHRLIEQIAVLRNERFTIAVKPGAHYAFESRGANWNEHTPMQTLQTLVINVVDPPPPLPPLRLVSHIQCPVNSMRMVRVNTLDPIPGNAMISKLLQIIPMQW